MLGTGDTWKIGTVKISVFTWGLFASRENSIKLISEVINVETGIMWEIKMTLLIENVRKCENEKESDMRRMLKTIASTKTL